MANLTSAPADPRAQDAAFVEQCRFGALQERLPLQWPTPQGMPDSPKKRYRSFYVYLGCDDLHELAHWKDLSDFELVLRLVDFSGPRPLLAHLLGWSSTQGRVPFDPVSTFLFLGWQFDNSWSRAEALRNLSKDHYRDDARRFGYHNGALVAALHPPRLQPSLRPLSPRNASLAPAASFHMLACGARTPINPHAKGFSTTEGRPHPPDASIWCFPSFPYFENPCHRCPALGHDMTLPLCPMCRSLSQPEVPGT